MSILNQLDRAKPWEDRAPFIKDGIHELAIKDYKEHNSTKNGSGVQVTLVVVRSSNPKMAPGSVVCQGWYPNHPPRYVGDTGQDDLDKIVDFMIKATGLAGPEALEKGKSRVRYALSAEGLAKLPLRGIRISCQGVEKPGKKKNDDGTPKTWTEVTWTHIPGQTPEEIKAMRLRVEAVPDPETLQPAAAAAQPVAQTQVAQPAAAESFPVTAANATPPAGEW